MTPSLALRPAKPSVAPVPTVHAAGGIVWRRVSRGSGDGRGSRKSGIEVLLVHRPRYDDWSWPKGKLEAGETLPACAVREIAEETGVQVVLGQQLPGVRYRLGDGRLKVCHYWVAQVVTDETPAVRARMEVKRCSPREVDRTTWVTPTQARKLLTRASDRLPLEALLDLWDEGALETRSFVVLRHARAKKRSAWSGGEHDRPLTAQGLHHAVDLTGTLSAFGVDRVTSSPWERCVATVVPYAELSEVLVELVPELTEAEAKRAPVHARRAVSRLLLGLRASLRLPGGEPGTVVCTHRPVLPVVLDVLAERMPNRVKALLPSANPYLRPGEMLVAHVLPRHRRGVRVVAIERHRVPR